MTKMDAPKDPVYRTLWTENLEDVDREIAKLATLCQVRILEPGVVRRVLQKDALRAQTRMPRHSRSFTISSSCTAIREKSVGSFGPAQAAAMEDYAIERLKKVFPELGRWPPA